MSYKMSILILLLFFVSTSCSSQTSKEKSITSNSIEKISFPQPKGYVNDFAFILDSLEVANLEQKLINFDQQTTNQIAIIIIDNSELNEANFDKYALELSNHWGIGTKEKHNGLSIVLSPKLRKVRINTGIGTEKVLSDEICKNVLQTIIIPEFKTQNYFLGLDKAIDEFIRLWK